MISGVVKTFNTVAEFNAEYYNDETYSEPWLTFTYENSAVTYNKSDYDKDLNKYLTFKAKTGGTIYFKTTSTNAKKTVEYKKNNDAWISITSNTGSSAPSIDVSNGDIVQFRGNNANYATSDSNYTTFSGTSGFIFL